MNRYCRNPGKYTKHFLSKFIKERVEWPYGPCIGPEIKRSGFRLAGAFARRRGTPLMTGGGGEGCLSYLLRGKICGSILLRVLKTN